MFLDDDGNEIKVGDTLSLIVGIPGREVIAKVEEHCGKLVVVNDEDNMSLEYVLRYYPTTIKETSREDQ